MRSVLRALLVGVLSFVACGGEDVSAQLKLLQDQLIKLSSTVAEQQKTIDEQKHRIDAQQKIIENVSAPKKMPSGPAAEIVKRLDVLESQTANAMQIATRKKPNDSNMAIGAAVDTAFRYFDGDNDDAGHPAGNDFQIRTAELVFSADVDQYFRSYMVILTHLEEGGGHGHAEEEEEDVGELSPILEEAAIYTTSLSHVQIKGGRFFTPIGRLSQIHTHDLPFTSRPLSLEEYVGGESGGDGVQVQALLPISHFLQITAGAFNKVGSEYPEANVAPSRRGGAELTYLLKALTSFNIGDDHTFEWGVSTLQVPDHLIRRNLVNMELTYRWHPAGSPLRERLVWGTEVMRNEKRTRFLSNEEDVEELGDDPIFKRRSFTGWGGYTYAEYFLNKNWSFGPRIDIYQPVLPEEAFETERTYNQTYSLFATYRFSEFSRLRAELNRHEFSNGSSANEFYLQWTVFWGAHTHAFDQR